VSDAGARLIHTAAENADVFTRPALAVISPSRPESAKTASPLWDAQVPRLRSRLVKILNVPRGRRVVPTARGWAGENATPPVFTRLRPCDRDILSSLLVRAYTIRIRRENPFEYHE
jgi:anti-sigma factor RsiW